MKDYLSKNDRFHIIAINHVTKNIDKLIDNLTVTKNITKEESRNLKTSSTLLKKAIESLISRQNKNSCKTLSNEINRSGIMVETHLTIMQYVKKKNKDIDAAYEENREYYKLVELIMHYNCRKCARCSSECDIYKEFEDNFIPELEDNRPDTNCKYSY